MGRSSSNADSKAPLKMRLALILTLVGYATSLPGGYFARYYPRVSYGGYRAPFTAFNSAQTRILAAKSRVQPRSFAFFRLGKVNANRYANQILNSALTKDSRIKAPIDVTAPTTAAALAYMKSVSKDDACGGPAQAFLQEIFNGKSSEEANAAAATKFIEAYNSGENQPEGGACGAAEAAYKQAFYNGGDPVLKATLAYVNAWPGVKTGNPCAVASTAYVKAIVDGESHLDAVILASAGYSKAFTDLARKGKTLTDPACLAASKAFIDAIPDDRDPGRTSAFKAFTDKVLKDGATPFDPVCLTAMDAFIKAYTAGDDIETANLKAAQSYFREFSKGSSIPADSPCTAATLAYSQEFDTAPSSPVASAMIAYITEAVTKNGAEYDPVCAAAIEAYFDEYIANKSDEKASEAASVAYIEALDKNPDFDSNGACGKAAAAYIAQY